MELLVFVYKLKIEADKEKFWNFIKNIDKPFLLKQNFIKSYDVFEVIGSEDGKNPDFDVVENIIVDKFDNWSEFCKKNKTQIENGKEWDKYADNDTFKGLITKKKA